MPWLLRLNKVAVLSLFAFLTPWLLQAEVFTSDICVYGSTSGGVVAAVQAARMGKSVTLVDPGRHLGGMTSGGLGWVDFGFKEAIGGMSREFIERIIAHYPNLPEAEWKQGPGWTFEPHVAEAVFREMLTEAKVPFYPNEELVSATKDGARLREITMANGDVFRAKMFIDATYEGDLMARAHVSYTIIRESNAQYGETINGILVKTPSCNSLKLAIDPYVKPGDPSSGLLPLVQSDPAGEPGAGGPAHTAQAYNYRLCLTQDPANKIPIEPPPDYDPARYELVLRLLDAAQAQNIGVTLSTAPQKLALLKIDPLPNGKTDVNNNGWVSTDYVGGSADYPEADYATRRKIAREHENYIRGLLHFLATSPRLPESIRSEMQKWGLCRDEFQDTGGWPFQLYVRESRRLIGAYVMTEHDCWSQTTLDDSIGRGSYPMDSHAFRRLVRDGVVASDGGCYFPMKTSYPISYRAITPKAEECENLLVPACLSASHAAYASVRMEPVFMILGQSAATAAALAIDGNVPLQKIDIKKLQTRLQADKQLL